MTYSACLELLFKPETPLFAERLYLANDVGFTAVEFWGWRNKDLDVVERALGETGLSLIGFVAEPMLPLTDGSQHNAFLTGLRESIATARRLGAKCLIAQAGDDQLGTPRERQHDAIVDVLKRAVPMLEHDGIVLLLEPLNTRVDHPGYYLAHTPEGLDLIEEIGSPSVRLLYDVYHSVVMGEIPNKVLAGRVPLIGHVHLADAPGRHEPGSASMPWRAHLDWLHSRGYQGYVGLEYSPSMDTVSSLKELGPLG